QRRPVSIAFRRSLISRHIRRAYALADDEGVSIAFRRSLISRPASSFVAIWMSEIAVSIAFRRSLISRHIRRAYALADDEGVSIAFRRSLIPRPGSSFVAIWLRQIAVSIPFRRSLISRHIRRAYALADDEGVSIAFRRSLISRPACAKW